MERNLPFLYVSVPVPHSNKQDQGTLMYIKHEGDPEPYLPVRSSPVINKAGVSLVSKALHSAVVTQTDVAYGCRSTKLFI